METWPDYWGTLPPKGFDLAQTVRPREPFPSAPPPLPPYPSHSKCPPRSQNELSLGVCSIFELEPRHFRGICPGSCQFFFGKAAHSSFKTTQTPKGPAPPTCENSSRARSAQNELKFGGDLARLLRNIPSKGFCSSSKDAALRAVSVGGASPLLPSLILSVPHVHKTNFRLSIDHLSSKERHTWYAPALGPASSFLVRQPALASKLPKRQRVLGPQLAKIRARPEVFRMSSNLVETCSDYGSTLPPKGFDLA